MRPLILILTLACNRGTARLNNNCDCDERSPATAGDDSSTGDTHDPADETGAADDSAAGGQAQGIDGWLTYTVTCSDEEAGGKDGYVADVEIAAVLPGAVVQVWGTLSDDIDTDECDFAVAPIAPPGVSMTEGLNYRISGPSTLGVVCRKYGDDTDYGDSPEWCDSDYVGWGPSSYAIHVLPMNSAAR